VFRAAPLVEPLDILGQPELTLKLSADRSQGFVAVLLVDEAPDGAQTLISRGFCNLTHRNDDTEPGGDHSGRGDVGHRARFTASGTASLAGHRLVVQVASAYWPILWPAPEPVTLTLRPGTSSLHLPVRTAPSDAPAPASPCPTRPRARQKSA
jgi:predicted acyl esterase